MPASLTNPAKTATDYDFSRQSKPAYRNAWIRAVCGDDTLTGPSNHLAHLLNYFVNSKSGLCCPAQDTLAKTGGISVSTVKRSLTILEQAGYIHLVKAVKGEHTYNCYFLLQPDNSLADVVGDDSLIDDSDVFVSTTAQREVPLHSILETLLDTSLLTKGRLFSTMTVDKVVKRYAFLRRQLPELKGTVFHSTRKWFITQCERTGTPEHFTASIVGHQSARSENKLTYGLYSAGISDEQKRAIVDGVRLPTELAL